MILLLVWVSISRDEVCARRCDSNEQFHGAVLVMPGDRLQMAFTPFRAIVVGGLWMSGRGRLRVVTVDSFSVSFFILTSVEGPPIKLYGLIYVATICPIFLHLIYCVAIENLCFMVVADLGTIRESKGSARKFA